ncbi:MAG: hypothetical protein P9L94_06680 [Candidatus Hinthialibacter antarcticus]|nr:hypothetical protein [Candidatus Hinthialibacter antarcticus]
MTTFELSRRRFNASLIAAAAAPALATTASAQSQLKDWQRESLEMALKKAEDNYDPEVQLVRGTVGNIGYHTTLKQGTPIHHTRSSSVYAAALLDSGREADLQRAQDILRKIISLQDQNPDNKTYGIWSWYYEEPLKMMSPPDWNWADFNGVQLLHAWIYHRDRLDDGLREALRESILHAARSIRKRNVGPGYTNIAIMGTYVTMVAGEQMDDDGLRDYAKKRLRRFHEATMKTGSFNEYNSPTYTVVALSEITRMMMHFEDADDRKLVEELNHTAWKHTAVRFHPPTGQWAGPHSRSYRTLLNDDSRVFQVVEVATGLRKKISDKRPLDLGLDEYRLDFKCPDELLTHFLELKEPKSIIETFQINTKGDVVGTTYLHPNYCIGSVNRGDFWVQRRPIIAYWGDRENPRYLQVRFLHDGYDFCSALPFTVQDKNSLLCHVAFANDYGDTHVSLDRIQNGTIKAKDLRLRFEFGGAVDGLTTKIAGSPRRTVGFNADDGDILIDMKTGQNSFGDGQDTVPWETGEGDGKKWVDAVAFHSDTEQEIILDRLISANFVFGLTVRLNTEHPTGKGRRTDQSGGRIKTHWQTESGGFYLETLDSPRPVNDVKNAVVIKTP